MLDQQYKRTFLKAALNSILPEFIDSDVIDNDSVSPEFIAILRVVADYYYGSDAITQQRIAETDDEERKDILRSGGVDYDMVTDLTGGFFSEADLLTEDEAENVNLLLGRFTINRNEDGTYDVTDVYDFSARPEAFSAMLRRNSPNLSNALEIFGMDKGTVGSMMGAVSSGNLETMATAYGELFMSDQVSPEEGGAQHVRFHIPREDAVDDYHPSPMVNWFEDSNVEPAFPASVMDSERKGLLDRAIEAVFGGPATAAPAPLYNASLSREDLLNAVRHAETGHLSLEESRNAVSEDGALGPYQFLGKYLSDFGYGMPRNLTEEQVKDPVTSRQLADQFISGYSNYHKFETPLEQLVAYNWGPTNAANWRDAGGNLDDLPEETKDYINRAGRFLSGS